MSVFFSEERTKENNQAQSLHIAIILTVNTVLGK